MKKIFFTVIFFGWSFLVNAACVEGDLAFEKGNWSFARLAYESCIYANDDAKAFYQLGQIYLTAKGVPLDRTKALLYFRYGAEKGYAPAQRELAKLMTSPLLKRGATEEVQRIVSSQKALLPKLPRTNPSLELSAFAWGVLAAERAENKWFYPSPALADAEAEKWVQTMEKKEGKAAKEAAVRQASTFKEQRLIWAAREIYDDVAFNQFMQMVFPQNGKVNYVQRSQAVEKLKQDISKK